MLRDRVVEVIRSWFADEDGGTYAPRVLSNASLDLAVAHGAAYYGVVRRGGGIRIGGGTARSFYVGFQAEYGRQALALRRPSRCQEGDEIAIERHDFDLLMGQPVAFPLASSSVRPKDNPGDLVGADPDSIRELPPLGRRDAGRPQGQGRARAGPPGGEGDGGRHGRALVPVADRRSPMAAPDPASRDRAARPPLEESVAGAEVDAVVIEQSEVDAAVEAIRSAFAAPANADEGGPPDS